MGRKGGLRRGKVLTAKQRSDIARMGGLARRRKNGGFLALPVMAYAAIAAGVVIIGLSVALKVQSSRLAACQHDFEVFRVQVETLGREAERKAHEKEKADAAKIQTAVSERDAALAKLRSNSGSRRVSTNPAAPAGSSQVCFRSDAYSAAFSEFSGSLNRFLGEAYGLAIEGDAAQIDAQTLIKSWPAP